jgi:hypothetical protein
VAFQIFEMLYWSFQQAFQLLSTGVSTVLASILAISAGVLVTKIKKKGTK